MQGGVPAFGTGAGSRHLSQILSYFFHTSYPKIADISPLNQLIAIAFLSLASMAFVKIINKNITYSGLIASLLLGLNPWYLQCLSYKYDGVFMACGTLCVIIPFLFIRKIGLFFIVSIIFLISMLNLYQTNNGIYLILVLFTVLNFIIQKVDFKYIIKFILVAMFAFVLTLLFYKFFITPTVDNNIGAITVFLQNSKKLLEYLNCSIGEHIVKYLFFISIPFFIIAILQRRKINFAISILLIFIFLIIGLFVSYGSYIFLSNFFPQTRGFMQVGAFLLLLQPLQYHKNEKFLIFYPNA